jgi:hypothetical protein
LVSAAAAALSATAAAAGLFLNAIATRQAKRTRELQVFDRVFGSIVQLEEKLLDAAAAGDASETATAWRSSFLSTLEYFAFLVNHRYLRDKRLAGFFSDAVIAWYRGIFLRGASEDERRNPTIYPELKALYARLSRARAEQRR